MTGPASFTPQPYPLRAIERREGAITRLGMVIGWTSDGTGTWTPVVAFDGGPGATEGLPLEGAVWEYQVPEPAERPRLAPGPQVARQSDPGSGGDTAAVQPVGTAAATVARLFNSDKPKKKQEPGRQASTLAPNLSPRQQPE